MLIGFICNKCERYNNIEATQEKICAHCKPDISMKSNKYDIQISYLKPFTDLSGNNVREITSKRQIREIEAREGVIFGGDDLGQEARKNRKEKQAEINKSAGRIAENTVKTAKQKGII